jgi:Predicted membrane protein (DUF2232)
MVGVDTTSNRSKGAGQLMIALIAIALAAGAASALMFASIMSGELFSIVLFYLAPLPLMVAAIGWGPLCAAIGGIVAAAGLGAIFNMPYGLAFTVAVAGPAWWLGHLALLGRPASSSAAPNPAALPPDPALEWYPLGRILLWISLLGALTTFAALLTLGTDAASINGALHNALSRILSSADVPVSADTDRLIDAMIKVAPAVAAIFATLTLTLNLWLAAKITAMSALLRRPWPDLKTTALPPMTLAALFAAIGICFSGGLLAMLAIIVTATLLMAYALSGFAVLHTLTLALRGRTLWLGSAYALVVMFVWPLLAMVALGLADAAFGLRQRFWRRQPPPLPAP